MTQESNQNPPAVVKISRTAWWLFPVKGIGFFMALFGRVFRIVLIVGLVLGVLALVVYSMQLDEIVRKQFEGRRWALPARVFARPLELFNGQQLYADHLEQELKLLSYVQVDKTPTETGQYYRKGDDFQVVTRGFQFADDMEPPRSIKVSLARGKVTSLALANKEALPVMRVEPVLIGNFYPSQNEDRVLIRIKDVSPLLINGLLAVEDKKFYEHQGVNPMAIARAMVTNLKAGQTVQGGSTITQQLVKNFYLTNERSWERKLKEALMALLLELHYNKQEILEAYLNEIYLGQDGSRAIHGFGLAAQFYFNRPIRELKSDQIALLIGLAKGAAFYDPRRFPERALERRNVVLTVMEQEGVLTAAEGAEARQRPLGVSEHRPSGASPFPAYLDLVRTQLQRDYREEDLRSEGLLIFTSMDPIVQLTAEQIVIKRVQQLERANRIPKNKLSGSMIISTVQGGEVIALVGGLDVRYPGYNHALIAQRQIGSLVKPAIYLAAFENKGKYGSLGDRVSDGPVTVKIGRNKYWQPGNYDQRFTGTMTIMYALMMSRNTPAVRVGVEVGLDKVIKTLGDLGIKKEIPAYPAILLGALELSPFEVQQMYQTLAANGSYSPLKSIRSVMNVSNGKTLTRYPLTVQQVARPESVEMLNFGLHQVTTNGTAKALQGVLPSWKDVAGKTGTTNDKKDSWFAGFSGQHVMTVWVGRDDSKPTNMTGGTGALKVWADMMKVMPSQPLKVGQSSRLIWVDVDAATGLLFNPACGKSMKMPFIRGTQPQKLSYCAEPQLEAPAAETGAPAPARPAAPAAPQAAPRPTAPRPAPQAAPRPAPTPAANNGTWVDDLMNNSGNQ